VKRIAPENTALLSLAMLYAEGRYGGGRASLADFRESLKKGLSGVS